MNKSRFIMLWVIIVISGIYGWYVANTNKSVIENDAVQVASVPTDTPQPDQTVAKTSLFVPYWSLSDLPLPSTYDTYLYFGIEATKAGIDTKEDGYIDLPLFLSSVPQHKHTALVVRMLDSSDNSFILENRKIQMSIISDTVSLAKQNGFDEVVLDLEMSAIPFASLMSQINSFNDEFARVAATQQLAYGITAYGDTFYRLRPFDIQHLAADADTIYIMSYDLHKVNADPGPNFPISTTVDGEYDLGKMLTDYEAVTPKEKITIVFGLFGYDWPIDTKGNSIGTGKAISYADIEQNFIHTCTKKACVVGIDRESGEETVKYIDATGQRHIIWFDTPGTVETKEAFLRERGIQSFSIWAWSYF